MRDYALSLLRALGEPVLGLALPDRRTYWGALAGAALLALWVWASRARQVPLARFFFPREVWLHASARADYGFLVLRFVTVAALFAPLAVSTLTVAIFVRGALTGLLGASLGMRAPAWFGALVLSTTAFVADDLGRYLLHRAMHEVPTLWELHKVHHSAEVLTPATVYRVHPVEVFLHLLRGRLTLGLVGGALAYVLPGASRGLELLGVEFLAFVWTTGGANLRHSQVWLTYGAAMEHVLVSPAQHQLHHSSSPEHRRGAAGSCNLGSALALWDWAFGTLLVAGERQRLTYGLAKGERALRHRPLELLWAPVQNAASRLRARTPTRGQSSLLRGGGTSSASGALVSSRTPITPTR